MAFVIGADDDQEPSLSGHHRDSDVQVDQKQFYAKTTPHDPNDIESHRIGEKQVLIGVNLPKFRGRRRRRNRFDEDINVPESQDGQNETSDINNAVHHSFSSPSIQKMKTSSSRPSLITTMLSSLQFEQVAADRLRELLIGDDNDEYQALFCELEEFQDGKWHERARWVRFEEDVEEGGGRWSKPFVATLPLHALFELRQCLSSGVVMLDITPHSYPELVGLIVDSLVGHTQLEESLRDDVMLTLMSKHIHQHEAAPGPIKRGLSEIGKKFSSRRMDDALHHHSHPHQMPRGMSGNMSGLQLDAPASKPAFRKNTSASFEKNRPRSVSSSTHSSPEEVAALGAAGQQYAGPNLAVPSVPSIAQMGREDSVHSFHKFNEHFARKLAPGTEASSTLVGAVPYLNHVVSAFVRLSSGLVLDDLTEVAVATRFVFVMLGPVSRAKDYHEIGRAMSTIMSDDIFRDVAYRSRNRVDLLAGLDEFLDEVTVLPPGEWDPTIRIQPPKSVPTQEERKMNALNQIAEESGVASPTMEKAPSTAKFGGLSMRAKSAPDMKPQFKHSDSDTSPDDSNVATADFASKNEDEENFFEAHCDPALQRTGSLFGGLISDIKRKRPFYLSDFKDALHIQCVASVFFMFFACLSPIVTFGGLLGVATENHMAAFESILTGSVAGTSYHLFSGQPLTVIGSTGPVLIFEKILYSFSKDNELNYLTFRFWVGMWAASIMMLLVAFDLSALVQLITRFTEECFAALISAIFIIESFIALFSVYKKYPVDMGGYSNCSCGVDPMTYSANSTVSSEETCSNLNVTSCTSVEGCSVFGSNCDAVEPVPDVFFFSCLLYIGTFALSTFLKAFRNTPFFPNRVREVVSDFAVSISIFVMVLVDMLLGIDTPKMMVPKEFHPTRPDRGWLVDPFVNPIWTIPAAILPAMLLSILLFMDQQITAVIVNRRENKLVKGCGYHLDFFILTLLVIFCATLGLPYFVAATVLAINHVNSLRKQSDTSAPGEQPKFLGIREQRVTGFLIFVLIACAIPLRHILAFIPMPVLYGVFLYMGVNALRGSQFFDRVLLIFMPVKYQPDSPYLRHMKTWRVHLFTIIQLASFVFLWTIKQIKAISITFPLMLVVMVILRKFLDYFFTQRELHWVDDILPKNPLAVRDPNEPEKKPGTNGGFPKNMSSGSGFPKNRSSIGTEKVPIQDKVNITNEVNRTSLWKRLKRRRSREKEDPNRTEMEPLTEDTSGNPLNTTPAVVVVSPSAEGSSSDNANMA